MFERVSISVASVEAGFGAGVFPCFFLKRGFEGKTLRIGGCFFVDWISERFKG